MVLDEADRAWIRYVAVRDQLLAARDEDNRPKPVPLATACPDDLAEIDLRSVAQRARTHP
jgi:hypothetical protein